MSDIVERARLYIKEPWAHQDNWHDLMNVLADGIERLESLNLRLIAQSIEWQAKIERLRADNEALRVANMSIDEDNDLRAEIGRLEAKLEKARAWASQAADALQPSAEENYRLKAEIERLQNTATNWKAEALRVAEVADARQAEIERLQECGQ